MAFTSSQPAGGVDEALARAVVVGIADLVRFDARKPAGAGPAAVRVADDRQNVAAVLLSALGAVRESMR
jgi:hypothetical protein